MLTTQNDVILMAPGAETSSHQPITSPTRNGWERGSRMRRLPGSPGRTWSAHLVSSITAAMLAAPLLVLPTTPADAEGKKCEWLDRREAECPSELLMAEARDSNVTLGGLRIGTWRSLEEGELEGIADDDHGRCQDWTWAAIARLADDGCTRTGSWTITGRDSRLGSSFRFTAGGSAAPDGRWFGWAQVAPMRFECTHDGDGHIGLFGADCEHGRLLAGVTPIENGGSGSEDPLLRWRRAISTSPTPPGPEHAPWTAEEADGYTTSLKWDVLVRTPSDTVPDTGIGDLMWADAGRVRPLP